jgi:hypothetical protein
MTEHLVRCGHEINRKRVQRLMRTPYSAPLLLVQRLGNFQDLSGWDRVQDSP